MGLNTTIVYILLLITLLIVINIYFKVADYFQIIDKPNERSLHTSLIIRGGGVIFPIAMLCYFVYSSFMFPYFILGLTLISLISFLDDILTLSNKLRISIHFMSIYLMFYEIGFDLPVWAWGLVFIIGTGVLNGYNFMDGINGITTGYTSSIIFALIFINRFEVKFVDSQLMYFLIIALIVFGIYNFRTKAQCFMGDVGSVSLAFIVIFLIGKLMWETQNITYVFLLSFYGIDVIYTIIRRLINRENIFKAHKTHFFQYLVDFGGWSHLSVTMLFMLGQALFNLAFIYFNVFKNEQWAVIVVSMVLLSIMYLLTKNKLSSKPICNNG